MCEVQSYFPLWEMGTQRWQLSHRGMGLGGGELPGSLPESDDV